PCGTAEPARGHAWTGDDSWRTMSDTGAPLSLDALFGAMLRAYRRGGLRETAAKIPINFSHLAKWERGERPVPAELVPALDRAYAANGALITLHELIARD